MRIAIISDIHGNLEALQTCLAHAGPQAPDRWAFIGDIVGYGADPGPVTDIVMDYAAQGAILVQGNHDAAAVGQGEEYMNDVARAAIRWTRGRLRPDQLGFLAKLPLTVREDEILFVHASAAAPAQWIYVTDVVSAAQSLRAGEATWIVSGHVHVPMLFSQGPGPWPQGFEPEAGAPIPVPRKRKWLAMMASCGQPRDGNPATGHAILDTDKEEITYFRLPYNHLLAARKIRDAGLPERLAARLKHGL